MCVLFKDEFKFRREMLLYLIQLVRYAQTCTVLITVKFDNRGIKMTPN